MQAGQKRLGVLAVAYAVVGTLGFYAVMGYGVLFLTGLGPRAVDAPVREGAVAALAVNLLLMAAFGVQHSAMARDGFKARLNRLVPPAFERPTFMVAACLTLGAMMAHWHPMPETVWRVTGPGATVIWVVFLAAAVAEVIATFGVDHLELVGIRQAWCYATGKPFTPPPFTEAGAYRYVRHPMMTFLFPFFWVTPVMSAGHLLLAIGMTCYIVIGTRLEERALVRTFGDRYRDYQRRVPMFFPRFLPKSTPRLQAD